MNRTEVIEYINGLKDYEGYVQFSHRAIDLEKDLFPREDDIEVGDGFVYEAHFCKDNTTIAIRQLNHEWIVSKTDISNAQEEIFYGIADLKIKMAQIWEAEPDALCEGMEVMRLQKVVFAGFAEEKGEA